MSNGNFLKESGECLARLAKFSSKFFGKVVKTIGLVWLVVSFIVALFVATQSDSEGFKLFLLLLAMFSVLSSPVWLYRIGVHVWGADSIKKFLIAFVKVPLKFIIYVIECSVSIVKTSIVERDSNSPFNKLVLFLFGTKKRTFYSLFFGIYLVLAFSYFDGYYLGSTLGKGITWFIFLLIFVWIFIILANKMGRLKIDKNHFKIPLLAIALSASLAQEIYYYHESENIDNSLKSELTSFLKEGAHPVVVDSDSKYQKFSKKVITVGSEANENLTKSIVAMIPQNIETFLLTSNYKDKEKLNKFLQEVREKKIVAQNTMAIVYEVQKKALDEVIGTAREVGISRRNLNYFVSGYENTSKEVRSLMQRKVSITKDILVLIEGALILLIEKQDELYVANESVFFNNQSDADKYNNYLESLFSVAEEEEKINEDILRFQEKSNQGTMRFLK